MFDQGFYNKVVLEPVPTLTNLPSIRDLWMSVLKARTPVRLGVEQADEMLAAMVARPPVHGSVVLNLPDVQGRAEHGRRCLWLWATTRARA